MDAEVVVLPYPAQGHINPAAALAETLALRGLRVALITTTALSKTATFHHTPATPIAIHHLSDGHERATQPETTEAYLARLEANLSRSLAAFLDERGQVKAVVYDSIMPWVLDIAHERGLLGAVFFTQSCSVSAVYYHLKQGLVRLPYDQGSATDLPALPPLRPRHLPSFAHVDSQRTTVDFLGRQFDNLERADWIFFNSFHKLESQVLEWMAKQWPVKAVGPTYLLLQKRKRLVSNHIISLFEPKQDEACREWLDARGSGSVVYVSFGSLAPLRKEQMEELAHGLAMSNCPFLWVVRASEMDKLQPLTSFDLERGLVVEWCHQPQVLAHRAVACFVSHCGWNSTLEALSHGVPLVAMGQLYDQPTNAMFVEDVWGFGIGVRAREDGIVGREEIAMRVKQVVEGDEGIELKKNACKWKGLADEAVEQGGTSSTNIDEFVSTLTKIE
ncbi:N-hydroxythioamide S-beta-glucosyltransferase [Salvia divinorum]|uniref:anthocyanidin 3-O-glucoside 5-O-glucosyltransferase n=1 Tax=Salvia divinorum TaxID=28513 RepID=A0ABD1HY61_SALDI